MQRKFFGQNLTKGTQLKFLWSLILVVSISLVSCSDDDKGDNAIVGEWVEDSREIYYQFNSNGTGRYICLEDEPGFSSGKIDAIIADPDDPYYFDYTLNGKNLLMREYWSANNKSKYTDYIYEVNVSKNQLKMKEISAVDYDGTEYNGSENVMIFSRYN